MALFSVLPASLHRNRDRTSKRGYLPIRTSDISRLRLPEPHPARIVRFADSSRLSSRLPSHFRSQTPRQVPLQSLHHPLDFLPLPALHQLPETVSSALHLQAHPSTYADPSPLLPQAATRYFQ